MTRHQRPVHRSVSFVALVVICLVGRAVAQPAVVNGTGNGFLLVELPASMGVYQVAMAEDALTTALALRFPSASSVQCVDMRVTTTTTTSTTVALPFALLFLIGDNPFPTSNGSAPPSGLPPLSVDVVALQADLSTTVPSGDSLLSLRVVPPTDVGGPLPSLQSVDAPLDASRLAFLRVDMSFRNLLSPRNLTQSLLFQTRRGVQTFLGLTSLSQVVATGPPQVPPASVLLVTQSFWVLLNGNATASDATLDNRQRLANLLIYGDPSRPVGLPDQRPAMFLDFAVDAAEPPVDPTVLLTLPYVFSSLSVDTFPVGNPPAPEPLLPLGTVVLPATPVDQLLARVRKRHVFAFFASTGDASASSSRTTDACPLLAGGGLCVKLLWNNTLDTMPFWVESLESVDALAWSVAPSTRFCASADTPLPLLPSPRIPSGGSASSVWAIAPLSATATRVAFALHLRSLDDDDNGATTRVAVEISAELRSALQAATTVTSIARRVESVVRDSVPVYATRSNVVVTYDMQFRTTTPNEITLALSLQRSDLVQKDTSQPCAHCQNLYEWCAAQAPCQALAHCVFRDGLEAAQIPVTLLQTPPASSLTSDSVVDVSSIVRRCLAAPADLDALLLFASAVRCQLQRQCAVRTPRDYGLAGGLDDRLLLWEASDGVVTVVNTTATNVTLRLLDTTLCTVSLGSLTGSDSLDDVVARQCVFANHLGRVTLSPVAPNATTLLELRFQDLVGSLPTIDTGLGTPPAVVTALPALRLRLERTDFAAALPPLASPPPPSSVCRATCYPLALDRCLRDLACVAFSDCITRFLAGNETTGDALLRLFERRVVGASLSLRAAVAQCEPSAWNETLATTRRAWRALVAASACLAKWDCALSLQGVVLPPARDGDAVVGKWRFRPTPVATQRLVYEQQPDEDSDALVVVAVAIPLTTSDSNTTGSSPTTSVPADAAALTTALRSLLQYDDLNVTLVANATTTDGRRLVQWEIAYAFWLGTLPRVIDPSLAPRWRLVDMPSETPQDVRVEMVAREDTNNSSSSRSSTSDTTSLLEIAVPMS